MYTYSTRLQHVRMATSARALAFLGFVERCIYMYLYIRRRHFPTFECRTRPTARFLISQRRYRFPREPAETDDAFWAGMQA